MAQYRDLLLNSGQLRRQVPVVNVPDDWNQNGCQSSAGSGLCRVCDWDGHTSSLFEGQGDASIGYKELRRSRCFSCQLISAVLESCVFLAFNVVADSK
ncbi:hypothetical protein ANO14919_045650 [Xylariales sp. No.14919]|nr:hypothetical protein ANO14919_045650 [Xylariales sp. No.14919]